MIVLPLIGLMITRPPLVLDMCLLFRARMGILQTRKPCQEQWKLADTQSQGKGQQSEFNDSESDLNGQFLTDSTSESLTTFPANC